MLKHHTKNPGTKVSSQKLRTISGMSSFPRELLLGRQRVSQIQAWLRLLQLAPESIAHSALKVPLRFQGLQRHNASALLKTPPTRRAHVLVQDHTVDGAAPVV